MRKKHSSNQSENQDITLERDNQQSEERLEGRNPIQEALTAGRTIDKLWVAIRNERPDPGLSRIIQKSKDNGAVVVNVERHVLDQMAITNNHQGIIAQVAAHTYTDFDNLIDEALQQTKQPLLLLLDELKDSYNLGAILRIADAAGLQGVIIPQRRSVSLNAAVARASAGALEYVPVAKVTNMTQAIITLKERGFWIAGTDASGHSDYHDINWNGPMAIVIGSEGEGLGPAIRKHCDFLISISMRGQVNSLNAAVATGIIVFEAVWNRGKL